MERFRVETFDRNQLPGISGLARTTIDVRNGLVHELMDLGTYGPKSYGRQKAVPNPKNLLKNSQITLMSLLR